MLYSIYFLLEAVWKNLISEDDLNIFKLEDDLKFFKQF